MSYILIKNKILFYKNYNYLCTQEKIKFLTI